MRLHIYLNEQGTRFVPTLFINTHHIGLSDKELDSLLNDILWIKKCRGVTCYA